MRQPRLSDSACVLGLFYGINSFFFGWSLPERGFAPPKKKQQRPPRAKVFQRVFTAPESACELGRQAVAIDEETLHAKMQVIIEAFFHHLQGRDFFRRGTFGGGLLKHEFFVEGFLQFNQ